MLSPEDYRTPKTPAQAPKPAKITDTPAVELKGPARLSDLREQYPHQHGFAQAVIAAVEEGDIGLIPVGDIVHVKRTE
jgi:hypothetical protein